MKLFYAPGACSLSAHIALKESGLTSEAIAAEWTDGDPGSKRHAEDLLKQAG